MKKNIIKRALISVHDKNNIIEFANQLNNIGIDLIATKGTYVILKKANIPATKISKYINFPEIMDGRLKTLHYKIYGGILGRRDQDGLVMDDNKILPIDMVIINFYSVNENNFFDKTKIEKFIDSIDIGGPAMVRAAAKNYKYVASITDINDYNSIINELKNNKNCLTNKTKLYLSQKAFEYTYLYDKKIKQGFDFFLEKNKLNSIKIPKILKIYQKSNLLYGENKHQKAFFYLEKKKQNILENIKIFKEKKLSYNNILDVDCALDILKEFYKEKSVCIIIKHNNPCSVAISNSNLNAYKKAYRGDYISAFGGLIAFNSELDDITAKKIISNQFVEIILAPCINQEVINKISFNKPKIKIITYNSLEKFSKKINIKSINGGYLLQENNLSNISAKDLIVVSKKIPSMQDIQESIFTWKIAKYVKSNAIVLSRNKKTIGIGAGQTSRIDATKLAILKAHNLGLKTKKCVMASDGFLPFRDNVDIAAQAGISCIIQPGGSIKDKEIISAANNQNIIMIFTKQRNFCH